MLIHLVSLVLLQTRLSSVEQNRKILNYVDWKIKWCKNNLLLNFTKNYKNVELNMKLK